MDIGADAAAGAFAVTLQQLVEGTEGWSRRERGALAAVTLVPVPTLNWVFVDDVAADRDAVEVLLDEVAAAGVPHCLQLRSDCAPLLAELASARGMVREADIPLMVLDARDAAALNDAGPEELMIRILVPEQSDRHARLAAAGFEVPEELFLQLMTPAVLSLDGVVCYLGAVGSEPATTGLGVTLGDHVGIFNIATPPAFRRRGYGAAVTARAVRDGFNSGARWAWLQSSPAGYHVYQRLGFRTIESLQCWLTPT